MQESHSDSSITFAVRDYDLAATLNSGQAFRWKVVQGAWEGVIGRRWVRLKADASAIHAQAAEPQRDWAWLADYLQVRVDLDAVLRTFPDDAPLRAAVAACRGLRLLRQAPWECLASFICSSTKQIVQIQQIIGLLCGRFGEPVPVPAGHPAVFAFPSAERLARCTEAELRACKLGFRAPNLLATAQAVASRQADLARLAGLELAEARSRLMELPGVGRKIADCVLLFAGGFSEAFPVDVWVRRSLRQLYFRRRRVAPRKLLEFTATYFGPNAGYAQQYLFHHARMRPRDECRVSRVEKWPPARVLRPAPNVS